MTDSEKEKKKVIKGLELCLTPVDRREYGDADVCHPECPYFRAYNMGDCIRALAKDALTLLKEHEKATIEPKRIDVERALKAIPAVDAAPVVHGEWKWSHGGECSECGFHNSNFDYRYCPMCGAKMDG